MRTVVFGASGEIGRRLGETLQNRGIEVVAAHRSAGVDVYTGTGVARACAGADVVVDCVNVTTTRAKVAVDFFGTAARRIAEGAVTAGVGRVVCLSIINAADPAVNAKFGYYRGKGEQERVYRELLGPDVLRVVHSAQWFELAEQLLARTSLGPVAVVPRMRCRPLAAADAADAVADAALEPARGDVEVAGPEVIDLADLAKDVARQDHSPRWVVPVRIGGAAFRTNGLLPRGEFVQAATTVEKWLAGRGGQVTR
ncbi:NmrA family transcriptional regulator [Gordonia sp. L191]|uniref:SDR family oxidoreductase n=1 Tax=Gordonia sp. L191 TaxID=2982699 RepID=UPI0024C05A8B|nr:NmrA family transcriptional regulator [Gordonia sp. L191]WHU45490.1 NmrA family transcriptional regulator [Gordonia sp. L191]